MALHAGDQIGPFTGHGEGMKCLHRLPGGTVVRGRFYAAIKTLMVKQILEGAYCLCPSCAGVLTVASPDEEAAWRLSNG